MCVCVCVCVFVCLLVLTSVKVMYEKSEDPRVFITKHDL